VIEFVFLAVLFIQLCTQYQIANSAAGPNSTNVQNLRLSGPISSVQYSDEGSPLWLVSGRWRMQVDADKLSAIPQTVRVFNSTLVMTAIDGSNTERYQLSNIKQEQASYDNKTNTLLVKGKISLASKTPIDNIGVELKLINKKILSLSIDPTQVRDNLGVTPIYGIER
jgi:hypothetical protein